MIEIQRETPTRATETLRYKTLELSIAMLVAARTHRAGFSSTSCLDGL